MVVGLDAEATRTTLGSHTSGPTVATAPPLTAASTSQVRTPLDALAAEEHKRIRNYAVFSVALTGSALLTLPLLGGDELAKVLHALGLSASLVSAGWVLRALSTRGNERGVLSTALGFLTLPALISGYLYWGELSAAAMIIPLATVFFGMGQSFASGLAVLLGCLVPQAVMSIAIAAGWMHDRSLIHLGLDQPLERLAVTGLIQMIGVTSFILTRQIRRETLQSMTALERASRAAAQREALLAEAREQLQLAARVGGPGRFTEQIIGSFRTRRDHRPRRDGRGLRSRARAFRRSRRCEAPASPFTRALAHPALLA